MIIKQALPPARPSTPVTPVFLWTQNNGVIQGGPHNDVLACYIYTFMWQLSSNVVIKDEPITGYYRGLPSEGILCATFPVWHGWCRGRPLVWIKRVLRLAFLTMGSVVTVACSTVWSVRTAARDADHVSYLDTSPSLSTFETCGGGVSAKLSVATVAVDSLVQHEPFIT